MNDSGSIVIIDGQGKISNENRKSFSAIAPRDFIVPPGCLISYELECGYSNENLRPFEIIKKGNAVAHLTLLGDRCYGQGVNIRIESSDAESLFQLLDTVGLYIGGKVTTLGDVTSHGCSCFMGIKNDFRRFVNWAKLGFQALMNRTGFMLLK